MEIFLGVRKSETGNHVTRSISSFALLSLALDFLLPTFESECSDSFKSILVFQNRVDQVWVFCIG
jgi:hypothetical protein